MLLTYSSTSARALLPWVPSASPPPSRPGGTHLLPRRGSRGARHRGPGPPGLAKGAPLGHRRRASPAWNASHVNDGGWPAPGERRRGAQIRTRHSHPHQEEIMSSPLARAAGPIALVSGLVFAAVDVARLLAADRSLERIEMMRQTPFQLTNALYWVVFIGLILALVSVYFRFADRAGASAPSASASHSWAPWTWPEICGSTGSPAPGSPTSPRRHPRRRVRDAGCRRPFQLRTVCTWLDSLWHRRLAVRHVPGVGRRGVRRAPVSWVTTRACRRTESPSGWPWPPWAGGSFGRAPRQRLPAAQQSTARRRVPRPRLSPPDS